MLQRGVTLTPDQTSLGRRADTESDLRPVPTSTWRKGYTEKQYEFPLQYITIPMRYNAMRPVDTSVEDQNRRFAQRYFSR
jgi:hypothetical protein